jgi:hypothetical protein
MLINYWSNGVRMGVKHGHDQNRMTAIRWWADKVGNSGAVQSNDTYKMKNVSISQMKINPYL